MKGQARSLGLLHVSVTIGLPSNTLCALLQENIHAQKIDKFYITLHFDKLISAS